MVDYTVRYARPHDFQTMIFFRNLYNHVHNKHTANIVCKNKKCKLTSQKNNTKQYFNRIMVKTDADDALDNIPSNILMILTAKNGFN